MAISVIDTGRIILARLDEEDLEEAQAIFDDNRRYHHTVGRTVAPDVARRAFERAPPKPVKGVKVFKRMLGIFPPLEEDAQKADMIGLIDIYIGYPGYQIATIATFLIRESLQHKGFGTAAMNALTTWLRREHPAVEWIDASVTDNNVAATKFLLKAGFTRTDSWHDVGEGDTKRRVIRLECRLKRA